jgi:hypothetical protein
MSEQPAIATPTPPAPPRRRSGWVVVVFLGLLGGLVVLNQLVSTGGPPIRWVENDLNAALAKLTDSKQRLFLYVYDPNDAVHIRNEREVFTQRWARDPLANVVWCRVALGNDRASTQLREEFDYRGRPLFLILTRARAVTSRAEGALTEGEFYAAITEPARRAHKPGVTP